MIVRSILASIAVVVIGVPLVAGPGGPVLSMDSANAQAYKELTPFMVYHLGDDESFSRPDLDVKDWTKVPDNPNRGGGLVLPDWDGTGWFRVRFMISEHSRNTAFAIRLFTLGATEIYLDGKQIGSTGEIDGDANYLPADKIFSLDPHLERNDPSRIHTLSFRVRTTREQFLNNAEPVVFFSASLVKTEPFFSMMVNGRNQWLTTLLIPFGMVISLGALHLLMWLFDRRSHVNLFYFAFAGVYSLIFIAWYVTTTTTNPDLMRLFGYAQGYLWALIVALAVLLISMIFYGTVSRRRLYITLGALALVVGLPYVLPNTGTLLWGSFTTIAAFDVGRLTVVAVRRKQEGAWVVGLGLLVFSAYLVYWFFAFYLELITLDPGLWEVIFISGLISCLFRCRSS